MDKSDPSHPNSSAPATDMAELFSKRFATFGEPVGIRARYVEEGLQSLAQVLSGLDRKVYCDVIYNDEINAYVTLEEDVYLIGITLGVHQRVFNLIDDVLRTLNLKERDFNTDIYESYLQELQYILYFSALTFIIGHECGHIQRGHIDSCLNVGQMSAEVGTSTSLREEVEADTVGILSILFAKMGIYRLCELTDAPTAVGLLQVPLACVFATLFAGARLPSNDGGYPHPVCRLMTAGRTVLNFMAVFATKGAGLNDEEMLIAESMLHKILDAIDPNLNSFIVTNKDALAREIAEMTKISRPIVLDWMNNSWQFMAFVQADEWKRPATTSEGTDEV